LLNIKPELLIRRNPAVFPKTNIQATIQELEQAVERGKKRRERCWRRAKEAGEAAERACSGRSSERKRAIEINCSVARIAESNSGGELHAPKDFSFANVQAFSEL
jgi:hypothetical protein